MASIISRAIPLWTRMFPKQTGPRGYRFIFDLTGQTSTKATLQLTDVGLDMVNGVFIDNSANNAAFTLFNIVTGQLIYVPANSQAMMSLLTPQSTDNIEFTGSSTGGVQVPVIFRNTEPLSDIIYAVTPAGVITGAVTVQGSLTQYQYNSVGVPAAAQTITTGGTPQSLFASNVNRKGILIANPASGPSQGLGAVAPESLFINFGGSPVMTGGGGTIEIVPGGYFSPSGAIDSRAIQIIAATTSHAFTATQFQ